MRKLFVVSVLFFALLVSTTVHADNMTNTTNSSLGTCYVKSSNTSIPNYFASDIGAGYAKMARSSVNLNGGLNAHACTLDDYSQLLASYCTQNSYPVQQMAATYGSDGNYQSSSCGVYDCNFHSCPTNSTGGGGGSGGNTTNQTSFATLVVYSTPSGAVVTNIDTGYTYCQSTTCTVQVAVPPNSVNIRISRSGYYDWTNLIYLYSGQTTIVNATLLSASPPPSNGTGGGSGSGNTTGGPRDNNTGNGTCSDTDGGRNYFIRGTVTDAAHLTPPTRTDYCLKDSPNDNAVNYIGGDSPENYLIEMYCNATYSSGMSDIYKCQYGCSNGACFYTNQTNTTDPCAGVTCNNPPPATCTGNNITRYYAPGICSNDVCSYVPYSNWTCQYGCANGACINQTDPCGNINCNNPPPPYCVGNNVTVYNNPGNCYNGKCSYSYRIAPCTYGCSNGMCNPPPTNGTNATGGGNGTGNGTGGGPRSASQCPANCECRYDFYGNIANIYCATKAGCNYNGVCENGETSDCKDCIRTSCPVSRQCSDGSTVTCNLAESGCTCDSCPIPRINLPQGCTQVINKGTGFVGVVCEKRACPEFSAETKSKCIANKGRPVVLKDANGCDNFQCDFSGQSSVSVFAAPSLASCPSEDIVSAALEKCKSLGLTGVVGFENGCKAGKCVQEKAEVCRQITADEKDKISLHCSQEKMGIASVFDNNGCQQITCGGQNECTKDLPKEAYLACASKGGELVAQHDDSGCVSFTNCLLRGDSSSTLVENVKELPNTTELLSVAFKLEDLRVELDKLAAKTNDIADYYKSTGSSDESRFRRASGIFSSAKDKVDEVKSKLRNNAAKFSSDDVLSIKQDIRYIKDVMLKDALFVMLSNSNEAKEITNGTAKDCGTDSGCFDRAVRVCQQTTFMPEGARGIVVQLKGLDGGACIMYAKMPESNVPSGVGGGPYEMTCKIQKYSLGLKNPETDVFPYCTGNLVEVMKLYNKQPQKAAPSVPSLPSATG